MSTMKHVTMSDSTQSNLSVSVVFLKCVVKECITEEEKLTEYKVHLTTDCCAHFGIISFDSN